MTSRSGESRDHSDAYPDAAAASGTPVTAGYAVAVIACVIAAAAQYFLQPLFGERFPLAAFPAAVVVAAWFGGFGPAFSRRWAEASPAAYVLSPAGSPAPDR